MQNAVIRGAKVIRLAPAVHCVFWLPSNPNLNFALCILLFYFFNSCCLVCHRSSITEASGSGQSMLQQSLHLPRDGEC
jgi:hypothetical protein